MQARQGKSEARVQTGQEQIYFKIKTDLEKVEAIDFEAKRNRYCRAVIGYP
jgi:hypothetical protein